MLYEHDEGLGIKLRATTARLVVFMASVVYLAYCSAFLCFAGSWGMWLEIMETNTSLG